MKFLFLLLAITSCVSLSGSLIILCRAVIRRKEVNMLYSEAKKHYEHAELRLKEIKNMHLNIKALEATTDKYRTVAFAEKEEAERYTNLTMIGWEKVQARAIELNIDINNISNQQYLVH